MKTFSEFLLEKRGRKSKDPNHADNVDYVRSLHKNVSDSNMSNTINNLVKKYMKVLLSNDIKDVDQEETNLKKLKSLIDKYQLEIPERFANWKIHEKDIVDGLNTLFKTGFFIKKTKETETAVKSTLGQDSFRAKQKGGSKLSDVQVLNPKEKSFFVECKLNLATAGYFKFGLHLNNGKLTYDHKFHVNGQVKKDDQQVKFLNELFTKKIDLNSFIQEILDDKQTKAYWSQLLDNIKDIDNFLHSEDEFKEFAKGKKIGTSFPEGFENIAEIFDIYCNYYIEKYNTLIDELLDLVQDDEIKEDKDQWKISKRSSNMQNNEVFQSLDKLIATIQAKQIPIKDQERFDTIVKQIKAIEIKFFVVLKSNNLDPTNFNSLNQLSKLNKIEYFFKMFVSTVGKKRKDGNAFVDNVTDELGNLQLCPEHLYDGQKMTQMITDYYVQKDHCAYIQIDTTLLQFDAKWNPLNIPDLPIFSETARKFIVKFAVAPKDLSIHLDIRLSQLEKEGLANKNIVSLKMKDTNWIQSVLKNVTIMLK